MRSELIEYFKTLNLGTLSLSEELPREESGVAMYIKNPKRIYVDLTVFSEEPLVDTLDGIKIHNQTQSVTVYFTVDTKTLPNNYEAVVERLRAGKDINTTQGFRQRECVVNTSYQADNLVTELEFRYTKLI